jgi:hypothetical protein
MSERQETFSLSGSECVIALCQLGFAVMRRLPGRTVLTQRGRFVIVPDVLTLPTKLLDSILLEADLSFATLVRALDEVPTNPELTVMES